jgi:hypothetical protein
MSAGDMRVVRLNYGHLQLGRPTYEELCDRVRLEPFRYLYAASPTDGMGCLPVPSSFNSAGTNYDEAICQQGI